MQPQGGGLHVKFGGRDEIQRLGDDAGEVFVLGVHGDFSPTASRLPQRTWLGIKGQVAADVDSEAEPKSKDGLTPVFFLTPAFARFRHNSRRTMLDNDRRFDFVPMLPPWSRPSRPADRAGSQQVVNRQRRRMLVLTADGVFTHGQVAFCTSALPG